METENLYLRELNPELYDYVFKNLNDNELMNFFGFNNADLILEKENHKKDVLFGACHSKYDSLLKRLKKKIIKC